MRCQRCGKLMWALLRNSSYCEQCAAQIKADEARQQQLADDCMRDLLIHLKNGMDRHEAAGVVAHYNAQGLRNPASVLCRLYQAAAAQFIADGLVTDAERERLYRLRDVLSLSPADVSAVDANLSRIDQITRIERGELPLLDNPGVPMQRNEVAHFVFGNVELHQTQVVSREYVGGSSSVSIRIARGVSYRVGAARGQMVSRSAMVHLATGSLLLTSKRLIYSAPGKSFSIPLGKVLNVVPYSNGAAVTKDSTAQNNKPYIFIIGDGEMLNVALSACLNVNQ